MALASTFAFATPSTADEMGPIDFPPGEAVGAPDHPHRGFCTLSYILDGGVQHKDSAGNSGNLEAGWLQYMRAGR